MTPPHKFRYVISVGQDELRRTGPMIPAAWTIPKSRLTELHNRGQLEPTPVQGFMLIDTGAAGIMVDSSAIEELGLITTGRTQEGHGMSGRGQISEYEATLLLPLTDWRRQQQWVGFPVFAWQVPDMRQFHIDGGYMTKDGKPLHVVGVLGRLFLQFVTFVYDGLTGNVEIQIDQRVLYPKSRFEGASADNA